MVRALAVVLAVALAAPAAEAQELKSIDLVKQLAQLLDAQKMDSFAAPDTETPGVFVAALYFPGTQLLTVSAKYSAPQLLTDRLTKKEYRDVYVDLTSASIPASRMLVMDTFADGLVAKPKGDAPADSVERGTATTSFDGEPKKAKLSDAEYAKAFGEADAAYAKMLQTLIAKLKAGS